MSTRLIGLVLLTLTATQPAAAQNVVSDWSLKAQTAITAGRSPASSEYLLALVHAAMYDAAVAVEGTYRPLGVRITGGQSASVEAAVATAAYQVTRQRVPSADAVLTADYTAYLAALPAGYAKDRGIAVGAAVAARWIQLRADDRFDVTVAYQQRPSGPGVWEPTATTPPVDVKLTQVRPYVMGTPDRFRPRGPRPLQSGAYTRAFEEVSEVGRVDSAARSAGQTEVARFWGEHTATQWNRNLRQIAASANLNVLDTARMLAMVHVASADAVVGCFDAKYHFGFWRPVLAIRRADTDDNPQTVPDAGWNALLNVNHPEYPSAHACWTQAVTSTLASVFGTDTMTFTLNSTVTGTARQYERFSDVVEEVADARIWAGLHFRFSTDDGASIGHHVSRLVRRNHFRPVEREH